jgi:hypothetical protein
VLTDVGPDAALKLHRDFGRRVAEYAVAHAMIRRGRLISATKSNGIIHTMRLWDEVVADVAAGTTGLTLEKVLIDALAARLVLKRHNGDVIVASYLFGDILSDLAAAGEAGVQRRNRTYLARWQRAALDDCDHGLPHRRGALPDRGSPSGTDHRPNGGRTAGPGDRGPRGSRPARRAVLRTARPCGHVRRIHRAAGRRRR